MVTTTTGLATSFITFSRTSTATLVASNGNISWAGHNLVLNSAAPVTQTVTVVSGAQYTVEMTGSGSVALSNAGSGTVTAGSPVTITASSTSLTLTTSGTVTTMWAYRSDLGGMVANPATSTSYYPTTSTAYYAPRLDFDGATLSPLGLLVEEQRTNLVLHNSNLTNVAWTASNVTAAKTATGPDGAANSATTLTASAANGTVLQSITSASAARMTSCYIKRRTGTGAIELTQDNGSTWTAVTVTSSWTRVNIASATVTNPTVGIRIVTSGDAVDVFGFQLENGTYPTSVIPTGAATATRAADVASVATQTFPYNSTEGTLVVNAYATVASGVFAQLDNGTQTNRILARAIGGSAALQYIISGGVEKSLNVGTFASGTIVKVAIAAKLNDSAASGNGGTVATSTSVNMPAAATILRLGGDAGSYTSLTWIRQVTYLPRRITNAELQSRTT